MRIGDLNSRVTIKQHVTGQDEIGQPVDVWEDVATVWANIKNRSGSEAIRADKEVSTVQASIRVRKRSDITAAMRAYHGAVIYEIKAVLPDEVSRDKMDLVCEVVA